MKFEEVKSALMWDLLPTFNKNLASCKGEGDLKQTAQQLLIEITQMVFPAEQDHIRLIF